MSFFFYLYLYVFLSLKNTDKFIKSLFVTYNTRYYQKQQKTFSANSKKLLVLFLLEDIQIKNLSESLNKYFKGASSYTINYVGFGKRKDVEVLKNHIDQDRVYLMSPKDFNMFGKLKSSDIRQVTTTNSFDYCFNLYQEPVPYFDLINAMANIRFNIGLQTNAQNKLSISVGLHQTDQFFKEVSNYLSKISYE